MKPIISVENPGKSCRIHRAAADAPANFRKVPAELPQKLLDVSLMSERGRRERIAKTYRWYLGGKAA